MHINQGLCVTVLTLDWRACRNCVRNYFRFMFGLNFYLTGFTLALFLYKEGGSIAENLTAVGVEMPGIVGETLEKLNKEGERK